MRQLLVPGETAIPETGVVISTSVFMGPLQPDFRRSAGPVVALQSDRLVLPLAVRNRKPGDRLRPAGAPGTRKLQDLLVDRKIPCGDRDRVPIVVDGTGQIVWVAGVAVAEAARVTAPESGMVILEIKKDAQ
jgi:tRNA(Ile)-lysidine synthase